MDVAFFSFAAPLFFAVVLLELDSGFSFSLDIVCLNESKPIEDVGLDDERRLEPDVLVAKRGLRRLGFLSSIFILN